MTNIKQFCLVYECMCIAVSVTDRVKMWALAVFKKMNSTALLNSWIPPLFRKHIKVPFRFSRKQRQCYRLITMTWIWSGSVQRRLLPIGNNWCSRWRTVSSLWMPLLPSIKLLNRYRNALICQLWLILHCGIKQRYLEDLFNWIWLYLLIFTYLSPKMQKANYFLSCLRNTNHMFLNKQYTNCANY